MASPVATEVAYLSEASLSLPAWAHCLRYGHEWSIATIGNPNVIGLLDASPSSQALSRDETMHAFGAVTSFMTYSFASGDRPCIVD